MISSWIRRFVRVDDVVCRRDGSIMPCRRVKGKADGCSGHIQKVLSIILILNWRLTMVTKMMGGIDVIKHA